MLTVAFATTDGLTVDDHFGSCDRFDVYELSGGTARFAGSREPGVGDRIDTRVAALRDCAIVHVASVGGAAAARIVHARIHPLRVAPGTPIDDLNARLLAVLGGNPPPWLRKIMRSEPVPGGPERGVR